MPSDSIHQTGPRGELGTLRDNIRIVVPAEVRRTIDWLPKNESVELIAELFLPGHIRVHQTAAIQPAVENARKQISQDPSNNRERLAALNDRFRQISYYHSDKRLHLTPSIVAFLRAGSNDETFYVEHVEDQLSIMTLERRNERLSRYADDFEDLID